MSSITGSQAADLFCQAAFRRSRGNGAKMVSILQDVLGVLLSSGGGFRIDGTECHPHVPGCDLYMAGWQLEFAEAMRKHISSIRIGTGPFPITDPVLLDVDRRNREAASK